MPTVRTVTIVGGGSAGWLTALALSTHCPFLRVRLVRPSIGAPVGVGESTQGDFARLLHASRLDLSEFYTSCQATLKCGIYYTDWNETGTHYWHPFADVSLGTPQIDSGPNYTVAHHYQQMILRKPKHYSHAQYYQAVHPSYETCVDQGLVSPKAAIAFHVDALRLTEWLNDKLPQVQVIEADQVDVEVEDGKVSEIVLDGSRRLKADLYVDCTGFSRAIIGRIDAMQTLPYVANVNRAVAAQVPYVDLETDPKPYTGAHAHEHGWTWSIPLQERFGSGYVYHGDFCTPEEAERNFRTHWGAERMKDVSVAHIAFDSATLRSPWVDNVVAIGLSAGFIEPLEATGLSWTIMSANLLCRTIAARYFDQDASDKYNGNIRGFIYDVQDFIDVHYMLSARRDSEFWRHQTSRAYPERLQSRLATYAAEMPTSANRMKTTPWAFHEVSWIDILNGYGFTYDKLDIDPRERERAERELRQAANVPRRGVPPLQCTPPPARSGPSRRAMMPRSSRSGRSQGTR